MKGRIIKHVSGFYYVLCNEEGVDTKDMDVIWKCRGRGIFRKDGQSPLVGDFVEMEITHREDEEGVINAIAPRKNQFIRPPVANVDCFVIVVAAAQPKPVPEVVDRFLVMAEKADTKTVICITKTDLDKKNMVATLQEIYSPLYPVVTINNRTKEGIDPLKKAIAHGVTALAGPSGVGKSTLINNLVEGGKAETGDVSKKTRRGKNTTRHVELFPLGKGGMIVDTPGFTSLQVMEEEEAQLQRYMPEFRQYRKDCQYDDCFHLREPNCGVRRALEEGHIAASRYQSYVNMIEEIRKNRKY